MTYLDLENRFDTAPTTISTAGSTGVAGVDTADSDVLGAGALGDCGASVSTVSGLRNFIISFVILAVVILGAGCSSLAPELPSSVDETAKDSTPDGSQDRPGDSATGGDNNVTPGTDIATGDAASGGDVGSGGAADISQTAIALNIVEGAGSDPLGNVISVQDVAVLKTDTTESKSGEVAVDLGFCQSQKGFGESTLELISASGATVGSVPLNNLEANTGLNILWEGDVQTFTVTGPALDVADVGCSRGWVTIGYRDAEPMWITVAETPTAHGEIAADISTTADANEGAGEGANEGDGAADLKPFWEIIQIPDLGTGPDDGGESARQRLGELAAVAQFGQLVTVDSGPFAQSQIEVHGWVELGDSADSDLAAELDARMFGVEVEWCNVSEVDMSAGRPKVVLVADSWVGFRPVNGDIVETLLLTTPGSCARYWLEFELHSALQPEALLVDFSQLSDGEDGPGAVAFTLQGGAVAIPESYGGTAAVPEG